jgi:hypothetical protein
MRSLVIYTLHQIIKATQLRRVGLTAYVARMRDMKNANVYWESQKERDNFRHLDADGRIILK